MSSRLMLVLHSHLPYVEKHGRWPFGEVWLFEAMAETYIPLMQSWMRMVNEGIKAPLTISLSPTLLEQTASPYIQKEFIEYLKEKEKLAASDEKYFRAHNQSDMAQVAADYIRFYRDVRRDFITTFACDIPGFISAMGQSVPLELMTTAATHAYLPMLKNKQALKQQIEVGIKVFYRHLGYKPGGFWLPECGYYQGLEDILVEQGIQYFFVDSHAIEGGKPPQVSSGIEDIFDEGEEIFEVFKETGLSTYRPYRVKGKPIAVFGRNAMVSTQVWSKTFGYPGDNVYREFHKQHPRSGLKYWKVSDKNSGGNKAVYNRIEAQERVRQHVHHFFNLLKNVGSEAGKLGFREPLIVACYDTELFGHWWWEGVDWLEEVVRLVSQDNSINMVLPSVVMRDWERFADAQIFESSWGVGGKHTGWYNRETEWMWNIIHEAQAEYNNLAIDETSENIRRAAAQARKELMLMQSSDWFFMVTNNHTRDYALRRFFGHYTRFVRLMSMIHSGKFDQESIKWLESVEKQDRLFEE